MTTNSYGCLKQFALGSDRSTMFSEREGQPERVSMSLRLTKVELQLYHYKELI